MANETNKKGTSVPAREGSVIAGDAAAPWRESKWLAVSEILIVLLIFIGDRYHLVPFSKTPFLFLLGWISIRLRKMAWKDVGLFRFRSWRTTLAYGGVGGIGMELLELFVTQPLLVRLTGKQPDLEVFRRLTGNFKLLLVGVVLSWVLAAFGEETVYRGYLMNRVADLGHRTRVAWIASLILVSALFGLAHAYQGITGMIDEGLMGLILGMMYLACGRSLSVPLVAHGVADTVDVLLIFLGKYPGM